MKETREAIGREIAIVGYATLGLFFIIALFSFSPFDPTLPIFNNFPLNRPPVNLAGLAGAFLAGLLVNFLGWPAFLAPFLFVFYAYQSYAREEPLAPGRLFFALLALVLLSGLVALAFQDRFSAAVTGREGFLTLVAPGGVAGCLLFRWGSSWLGSIGAALIYSALLLLLIFYALSLSLRPLSVPENRPAARKRAAPVPANAEPVFVPATTLEKPEKETAAPASGAGAPVPVLPPVPSGPADGNYHLPPLDLLIPAKEDSRPEFDLDRYKSVIEDTIADFGILVKAVEANVGPTVTMFELELSPGVMPQRIVSLQDNLAMALRATSVRVVAPLPGKSTVGVEVPNPTTSTVYLSEIVGAPEFGQHRSKIALALGKDTLGRPLIADLRNMPHILIAGATGSGKTVCLNSLLISFLYRATPEEVQLVLIDPKMVEMSVYNELPHLLLPVVTEARSAIDALKWMVGEMERRYRLFSQNNVRSIDVYNSRDVERIPYIVIVIDELADLITVARNDVESNIMRLSQLARAAGIHLIIATQRPSVNVITGVIKANLPARIAFQVSSKVDSRTILDANGAEKLLGRGDMLYLAPGALHPIRSQGCYLSDQEMERVCEFWKRQGRGPTYDLSYIQEGAEAASEFGGGEADDPLFNEAVKIVLTHQLASISLIQRRLKIGFNRSARLIEEMEKQGIVGPYREGKPREILKKS